MVESQAIRYIPARISKLKYGRYLVNTRFIMEPHSLARKTAIPCAYQKVWSEDSKLSVLKEVSGLKFGGSKTVSNDN